jgi:hypothetical protein
MMISEPLGDAQKSSPIRKGREGPHPAEERISPPGFPLIRLTMHQTVMAACSTTAGHKATPTVCDQMPAAPRMTTAPRLYSTIAATNPLAAGLCVSPRASQQATPSGSNPPPPTRATVKAADASSGAPSRSATVAEGKHSSAKPAPSSITAVAVSRVFTDNELLNERQTEGTRNVFSFSSLVPLQISFSCIATLVGRFGFRPPSRGRPQTAGARAFHNCYRLPAA